MRIRSLTWQFFLACILITVIPLMMVTWYSARVNNRLYLQTTIENVTARAFLLTPALSSMLATENYRGIDSLCKHVGKIIATRITVVLPSGQVIGDSERDPMTMENHALRPEIIPAFSGEHGLEQRYSTTINMHMLFVAVPLKGDPGSDSANTALAALRMAVSLEKLRTHELRFYRRVGAASVLIFLLFAAAALLISRQLSTPIQRLKAGAQRFAAGDLAFKLSAPHYNETAELAEALNTMAQSLDSRIHTITRQRNELNTILAGMAEGVIAVDTEQRVISINPAGAGLLGIDQSAAGGKWLHELVRNSDLQKFVSQTLSQESMVETTLQWSTKSGERHIQAHGSILKDGSAAIGAVFVLNDVTRLRKLEEMRKEFVANVSHELRTPLTSIKGFVETIQTGSYSLPGEVTHFLEIISGKTERLCSIVDDILTLSSIERDHDHREIPLTTTNIRQTLEDSMKSCSSKASGKGLRMQISCEPGLTVRANPQLLEQAVVNLIDNAVKYSDSGDITICAEKASTEVVISVSDNGCGIASEHVDRVFERFYRVDKARSRKLGGTGLGLSIVKNITTAHGGRVSVDSQLGKGSTFRIHLPSEPFRG